MSRPNFAKLDLNALRNNVEVARMLAPQAKLMAVVKANAYGHGAVTIATALEGIVDALAVACLEEARELRSAGVNSPILLLQGVFEEAELQRASELQLWTTIENERQLQWLEQAELAEPVGCWLKVDTGMSRLGVKLDQVASFMQRISHTHNALEEPVLTTHFASADDIHSDMTRRQLAIFDAIPVQGLRSAANSAGVLAWPPSHYDWIRPGYMLYGNTPLLEEHHNSRTLQPVMTLTSAVISLREVAPGESVGYAETWVASRPSRIATVTIGYGDGYPRSAANGTPVLINGQRASLAGRVSMDMITVDVTGLDDVTVGDEVVLWGDGLPLADIAQCADTIGYELTTRMPARTRRMIVEGV